MSCFVSLQLSGGGKLPSPEYAENGTGQTDKMDGRYFDSNIRDFSSRVAKRALPERSRMSSGLSFFQLLIAVSPNRRGALRFQLAITWLS